MSVQASRSVWRLASQKHVLFSAQGLAGAKAQAYAGRQNLLCHACKDLHHDYRCMMCDNPVYSSQLSLAQKLDVSRCGCDH